MKNKWYLNKALSRCTSVVLMGITASLSLSHMVIAAEAADSTVNASSNKQYTISAGPLGEAISNYAAENGMRLTFDPSLTEGKTTQGLQGQYTVNEGFSKLLNNSGLEMIDDQAGGYFLVPSMNEFPALGEDVVKLDTVNVRAQRFYELGPLPGLGLTKEEIPGNVQSISAEEIKNSGSLSMTDLFNSKLQGVTVNDYQGNPFQMDVQYRGFTAGPQIGTPQGLSVFMDGIRVNEPFGDVVNWDMIPMNAISAVDVFPGSNPIFGLNTLGGAFTMKTKDGFNNDKADVQVLAGSFGRKQLLMENGWNNGKIAFFGAASLFDEEGWRDSSPSKVNQFFGKASYRADKLDLHLSTLIVKTDLVGNGLIPTEEYRQDRDGVFTAPDVTENSLQQFQLSGAYQVNDTFSVTSQIYRRNSRRNSQGADAYTDFDKQTVKRNLAEGEQYTCLFETTNDYNLPDYHVVDYDQFLDFALFGGYPTLEDAFAGLPSSTFNAALPAEYVDLAQRQFAYWKNLQATVIFQAAGADGFPTPLNPVDSSYDAAVQLTSLRQLTGDPLDYAIASTGAFNFTDENGQLLYLIIKPPTNADKCSGDANGDSLEIVGPEGGVQTVDGAAYSQTNPGVVDGTPTGVFTDNVIDQVTDGFSIQLNWNLDKHKFMVGASIDRPTAEYTSSQRLGLFTASREFFLAPDQIRDQYVAADVPISSNNFEGEQLTKSLYFSETWSPVETWHFNVSARYNDTHGQNRMKSREYGMRYVPSLAGLEGFPDYFNICAPGEDCPTGYVIPDTSRLLNEEEKENFSYYSLNPSFGVAWQAKETLNIYANFAQGVRVPSVVELGCALDKTLVNGVYKSLRENRTCSLPSTLSGDPYLPQIKAETWEVGLRGLLSDNMQWNLAVYQTNLKDDLYLISFPGNRNFFDTIGNTRRQGIEAGVSGQIKKWGFSVNYALTDATFEDNFTIAGNDNSSSYEEFTGNHNYSRLIDVEPGDRMPGVSLHNLNATVAYQFTPKWDVGFTAIAHSESFVRGNENNKHQRGVVLTETREISGSQVVVTRKPTSNPGKIPGYMTFNVQSTYRFDENLSVNLLVNNVFDHEYFTAGTLGRNPFSPGTYGAIGPDGYNHNSLEWDSTNFVAPGAPRGAWLSLRWQF